jgi:hypothetical protein
VSEVEDETSPNSGELFTGRWQSGQLHQTVNLASSEFGGSNPSLPTGRTKERRRATLRRKSQMRQN